MGEHHSNENQEEDYMVNLPDYEIINPESCINYDE